ncbi:MAG: heme NO-binding domain-containing protein [Flavobacteriales bacterium]|nr:heme NO-binding domain-containing protein [Flavobacteriales bacterium]
MKGVVITQFLEMVEERYGMDVADQLLQSDGLSTHGVFTSVGTYPHTDAVLLMSTLARRRNTALGAILQEYGEYLFGYFTTQYPVFFNENASFFDFLLSVEEVIHPEVLKLYPDAQLPRFQSELINEQTMRMVYLSDRCMGPFAHGLILGCAVYFNVGVRIASRDLDNGRKVEFIIQLD